MKRLFGFLLLFVIAFPLNAEQLMMVRVKQSFPETMLKFQEVIKEHGYQLSRVQRVDIGLTNMGYQTDKYRIVFFGKLEQNRWIVEKHPELIAYLPIKVAIYAEEQDTLMVAPNLELLINAQDPQLKKIVSEWQRDIRSMFKVMHDFGAAS